MSKIDDMIKNLCPDGVEYKPLGETCFYPKQGIDFNSLDENSYVGVENLLKNKSGKTKSAFLPKTGCPIEYLRNDILIGNIRPYLKKIWIADNNGGTNGDVVLIRIKKEYVNLLLPPFLYYLLSSDSFFEYDTQYSRGAKMPRGDRDMIAKYPIPLPPLPIQEEIVKILYGFTRLEAELEAELEVRKKQYEYYCDKLLSFEGMNMSQPGEIRLMAVSELCDISRGRVMSKKFLSDNPGNYPVYSSQTANDGVLGRISTFDYDGEYLTWTTDGANAGSVFHRKGKFSITNVCGLLRVKHAMVLPRYLFYILKKTAPSAVNSGMGNPKLMSNMMGMIKIPVPAIKEQERIVSILDKFDALVNDFTIGLPAALTARRQQYEYYRDRLLSFKKRA